MAYNYILKKAFLTVCLFYCLNFAGNCQCIPDDNYLGDYNKIIALKGYENIPSDPISGYLKHLDLTINYLITEDDSILDSLQRTEKGFIDTIINKCKDPYKTFYLAEIKLRNAFISAKTGNELTATWQIRQAYKMLNENILTHSNFISQYKTMGLLHILLGSVPEKHQWIINLLGMEGDIKMGLNELKMVSEKDELFKLEAMIYGLIIDAFLLNQPETASGEILNLIDKYPKNELIAYVTVAILLKNNDAHSAINLLSQIEIRKNPLLFYQAGEVYLQSGNYDKAKTYYLQFLQQFKGENFVKDTYFKLFLTQWLSNNKPAALDYYELARSNGRKLIEADKNANSVLRSGQLPHPDLMKVRLFTDGGYFKKADSIVNYLSISDFQLYSDQTELLYRVARLNHKQNKLEKARKYYLKVISRTYEGEYFIPNSSLQLGYIMLELSNDDESKKYFKKALSYNGYQYESSIKNKAKSALKFID